MYILAVLKKMGGDMAVKARGRVEIELEKNEKQMMVINVIPFFNLHQRVRVRVQDDKIHFFCASS